MMIFNICYTTLAAYLIVSCVEKFIKWIFLLTSTLVNNFSSFSHECGFTSISAMFVIILSWKNLIAYFLLSNMELLVHIYVSICLCEMIESYLMRKYGKVWDFSWGLSACNGHFFQNNFFHDILRAKGINIYFWTIINPLSCLLNVTFTSSPPLTTSSHSFSLFS